MQVYLSLLIDSLQFDSLKFDSLQFDSLQFDSLQFDFHTIISTFHRYYPSIWKQKLHESIYMSSEYNTHNDIMLQSYDTVNTIVKKELIQPQYT